MTRRRHRGNTWRTAAVWCGAALVFSLVFAGLAWFLIRLGPAWLAETEGLGAVEQEEARGRVRTALLALAAGAVAIVSAIYTARTFSLNRRGQITERFTRAIDQLGSEKIEVRLGGIYALERIAHESADEHHQIVEVLSAYVRKNSPVVENPRSDTSDDAPIDVKAILTVLARRVPRDGDTPIDLIRSHLAGVQAAGIDLRGAQLAEADLRHADLQTADFTEALLAYACLNDALLLDAQFVNADMAGATFVDAVLADADFSGAGLQGADLTGADLTGTLWHDASLYRAQLGRTDLTGADLAGADLTEADLSGARCNAATAWPSGFDWRGSGVVSAESLDPAADVDEPSPTDPAGTAGTRRA